MVEASSYPSKVNRTSLNTSAGTSTYSYVADTHHLVAVGGEARGYDAAGNTTSIGSKAFTYNDANRMSAVKLGGTVAERYVYNHRGERVLRAPEGGNAQITVYDEAGQWLGNYSAAGQAQQQAIWLDNYPVALISVAAAGVPELAYIQPDHLGTPRVVIDPVRDVAIWEWSSKSEVFGDQAPANDPDGDGVAFELALRFPGQQATDASGLFYNYQREYDPAVGRYSQSDPIGLMGGINTYLYVRGTPAVEVDRFGLCPACVLLPLAAPEAGAAALSALAWVATAVGAGWLGSELIDQLKTGDGAKPKNCPTGTLPIDKAKKKFGLDHDAVETIKDGAGAGPNTWTGIAPNGDIWVGTPDGKGRDEGNIGDYGY